MHEFHKNSDEGSQNKHQQLIDREVEILYNIDEKSLKVELKTWEAFSDENWASNCKFVFN